MGPPCTGKSTLLKEWEKNGGQYVAEFLEPVPDFVHNSWIGDENTKLLAEQWALQQNIRKDEIIQKRETDLPLLVERCPLDVLVYARAFGGKAASWTEREVAKRSWSPGKLILLTTDIDVLKERWMTSRNLSLSEWNNQWLPLTRSLYKYYEELRQIYDIPSLSTEKTIDETFLNLKKLSEISPLYHPEGMVYQKTRRERE